MKATRKNLEKLVARLYPQQRVDVYRGVDLPDCVKGWYMRPFGKTARYLGLNLSEALKLLNIEIENL